jgi:hypothetical protein
MAESEGNQEVGSEFINELDESLIQSDILFVADTVSIVRMNIWGIFALTGQVSFVNWLSREAT